MSFQVGNLFREVSYSLRRNPSLFFGSLVTIMVSLTFLGGGWVLSTALENSLQRWSEGVEFIVFMNPDATGAEISAVSQTLETHPNVESAKYLDKEAAYLEFQSMFQDSPQIIDSVGVADLPSSFRVVPASPEAEIVEALADGFRDDPGVFEVAAGIDSIRRFEVTVEKVNLLLLAMGIFLLFAAVLLVYNVIRTTIFARRREVEVMRLVGASNWYIRLPFMAEGVIQGFLGGVIAYALLQGWNGWLSSLFSGDGFSLLQQFHAPAGSVLSIGLTMTVIGVLIGALASAFALTRFLDV